MAGESNKMKWVGVRPTDPEEAIPVKQATAADLKVEAAIAAGQTVAATQATATNLKAEAAIAAGQTVAVTQATAANLNNTQVSSYVSQNTDVCAETAPGAGDVLMSTGAIAAGRYDFTVILSATADHAYFSIEHRNATDTATLQQVFFTLSAYAPFTVFIPNWTLAANERVRVVCKNVFAGDVYGGIFITQRT